MLREKYIRLIRGFVEGEMSVKEFEQTYLTEFKAETEIVDDELFNILDRLFACVDSYWPGCQEGQETAFEISEAHLRRDAAAALAKLNVNP